MKPAIQQTASAVQAAYPAQTTAALVVQYPPLETVTRPNLTNRELAYYSNMAEQTWRVKACRETLPEGLRPLRICGRLAWPTAAVKQLLGVQDWLQRVSL